MVQDLEEQKEELENQVKDLQAKAAVPDNDTGALRGKLKESEK